jgi:hypothetical protein
MSGIPSAPPEFVDQQLAIVVVVWHWSTAE